MAFQTAAGANPHARSARSVEVAAAQAVALCIAPDPAGQKRARRGATQLRARSNRNTSGSPRRRPCRGSAPFTAVAALPPAQRGVLLLVAVERFSFREASDLRGVLIGTLMSRLSRARVAIGERFASRPRIDRNSDSVSDNNIDTARASTMSPDLETLRAHAHAHADGELALAQRAEVDVAIEADAALAALSAARFASRLP